MVDRYVCYEGKDHHGGCGKSCRGCQSYGVDRRKADRRNNQLSFRLRERREGFDRRQNHLKDGVYHRVFRRGAFHLRYNQQALVLLLIAFNMLNLADYLFTLKALEAGMSEGNPVMQRLFEVGPTAAAIFKLGLTMVVTMVIWSYRKYRAVLEISILFIIMYMILIGYHIYGRLFLMD